MINSIALDTSIRDKIKTDSIVIQNFKKVSLNLVIVPFLLLLIFFSYYLFSFDVSFVSTYVDSQKDMFLELNEILSTYPNLAYNVTYLGDARVMFPFIFIFLFVAPKLWEALLTSSILTLITSAILKHILAVPRPAAVMDMDTFTIMGRPNILHTSLPSGHAMTAFMIITILLFAFMPKKMVHRIYWTLFLITIACIIGLSRVAVGAHYPGDVLFGACLGFIIAVIGINLNRNISWLYWMKLKKYYPIIFLILMYWFYLILMKTVKHNIPIFYFSLIALMFTFFSITKEYVKKN